MRQSFRLDNIVCNRMLQIVKWPKH